MLGSNAFEGCTGLKQVTLNGGLTQRSGGRVQRMQRVESLVINRIVPTFTSGALNSGKATVTFGSDITEIPDSAFQHVYGVKALQFDGAVTCIGELAFIDCRNLTDINLPQSLTTIGESAFNGCRALTSVSVPDSVDTLGIDVFANCSGLVSASLGSGLSALPADTFRNCTALETVSLPDALTSIGNNAFDGCTNLTALPLTDSVTSIGEYAFNGAIVDRSCRSGSRLCNRVENFNGCLAVASVTLSKMYEIAQRFNAVPRCSRSSGRGFPTGAICDSTQIFLFLCGG